MGMAASQARFLGLTARKNNVEYEGQQINQQRVVLSNETANYYNDLLGMSVPVPPSAADYTKVVYSFEDGALRNSITSMIAKPNGEYMISYTANWTDDFAAVSAPTSIVTRIVDATQTSATSNSDAIQADSVIRRLADGSYTYNGIPLSLTTTFDVSDDIPQELKDAGMPAGTYYTYEEKENGSKITHYIKKENIEDLNYKVKEAAQTSNFQSSGSAPNFTYTYGSHVLEAVTFDANNAQDKPEGLADGKYYRYTADGETHYFTKEAVELQNVSRGYSYYFGDTPLTVQKITANNLPTKDVKVGDIDGGNIEPSESELYFKYSDETGDHYVKVGGTYPEEHYNGVLTTENDDNGNVTKYVYKINGSGRTYECLPTQLEKFDKEDKIPTKEEPINDADNNPVEIGKEYAIYNSKDNSGNDVTVYKLLTNIGSERASDSNSGYNKEVSYFYGNQSMGFSGNDTTDPAAGIYFIGDHQFDSAKVVGDFYSPDGKYGETSLGRANLQAGHFIDDGIADIDKNIGDYTLTENYQYNVGAKTFRVLGSELSKDSELRQKDEYYKSLSDDQFAQLLLEEKEYIAILNEQYGNDSKWMVRYEKNTSSNSWYPIFTKLDKLGNTIYTDNGSSLSYVPMYTIGSAEKTEEVKNVMARFEQDATGRIINVTLHPGEEDQVTYAVSTETVTDQAKYDDAMNQYEYDKAKYDQTVQEINAKIEIIQAEDRSLELRLKQLDTEQDAISTEMDAVQKVIEKNVESSFKTFG